MAELPKPAAQTEFKALGTEIYLEIVLAKEPERSKANLALKKIKRLYQKQEKIFSRFDPESELSKLNNNLGIWQKASLDLINMAGRALYYHRESRGIYDPRIIDTLETVGYRKDFKKINFALLKPPKNLKPMTDGLQQDLKIYNQKVFFGRRMDFSGIAKGYITDRAVETIKKARFKNFLVDSGGDIYAAGKNNTGSNWKIAIEEIPERELTLLISGKGVATSGITRKNWRIGKTEYHHLINPKNPNKFSYQVKTVTVIAGNTELADGKAKTLLIMGSKTGKRIARQKKYACIFLDADDSIWISPEARKYLRKNNA